MTLICHKFQWLCLFFWYKLKGKSLSHSLNLFSNNFSCIDSLLPIFKNFWSLLVNGSHFTLSNTSNCVGVGLLKHTKIFFKLVTIINYYFQFGLKLQSQMTMLIVVYQWKEEFEIWRNTRKFNRHNSQVKYIIASVAQYGLNCLVLQKTSYKWYCMTLGGGIVKIYGTMKNTDSNSKLPEIKITYHYFLGK